MTIRVRLATWYAVAGAVILIVLGVVLSLSYGASLRNSLADLLKAEANAAREVVEGHPTSRPDIGPLERGLFLVVFAPSSARTYASRLAPVFDRPEAGASTVRTGPAVEDMVYAVPLTDGQTVVAGASTADIGRALDHLLQILLFVGAAGTVLLIFGGWWLAGRALAPVAELTRDVDAIQSGDLADRLPQPVRDDELGALTRTLNRMLARVEDAARRQRAFVIGASHDLRTPLTTLRAELELALAVPADAERLRDAVEAAHGDAVRLTDLATGLLRLADSEADGRPVDRQDVPLRPLVDDCLALVATDALSRDVLIRARVPEVHINADRARLEGALANLLGNAVRHAPPRSMVEIDASVDGGPESRALRMVVRDRGPGVARDVRGVLFQPFARSRHEAMTGSGLGLATAAAAVRAHGGEIDYEDRPGGGAIFSFWIPA